VWDLVENLERCGVTNAIVTNETSQNLADHFGEFFDRVLLDAPCSGEGMFRKSEIARKEWKTELEHSCAKRQSAILDQAGRMVKPGGHLAYTTCTFSAEENEGVIAKFLTQHPEFELDTIKSAPGYQPGRPEWVSLSQDQRINRSIRIWPHKSPGEGHFIALFIKQESAKNYPDAQPKKTAYFSNQSLLSKRFNPTRHILDDFCRANLSQALEYSQMILDGTYIYQVPDLTPDLEGLNVIHPGWWLGSISKDRFTPSHSLAMGITTDQVKLVLALSDADQRLAAYFGGESFPDPGDNGWILVTVSGFPVGWAKRVQNVVKNFYPHGLRRTM
jgi:NOL1/NOP2/fmu family ribosome biogenesis protein